MLVCINYFSFTILKLVTIIVINTIGHLQRHVHVTIHKYCCDLEINCSVFTCCVDNPKHGFNVTLNVYFSLAMWLTFSLFVQQKKLKNKNKQ